MLALRKTQPAPGAALVDVPRSEGGPPPGQVEIRIGAAGICGSDLHAFEWTPGYEFMTPGLPLTMGHEFSGIVRAVGEGVIDPAPGDRVVCWPTITCGACESCRDGRPQDCTARRIIGLHRDGGFTESIVAPAGNCRVIPDGLPLQTAALAEPLSIAVNAVDISGAGPGDAVVVLGPGPIGMAAAWVARNRGADVLLVGLGDGERLAVATTLGLLTADLRDETLADAARRLLGRTPDRVIEATGAAASVTAGLELLRPRGILVVAGIHKEPCPIDLTAFVRQKKQMRGAHDTTSEALSEAIRLLDAHSAELSRLITHRLPLERALEAIDLARSRKAVKVLLLPPGAEPEAKESA
ncbi:MAG: alcohol dehydrogenase catalytic domain-containing protein [Cereibacter changlensis]|uniref:Sorbitol dehydrogenase n=2 Tax=Cereibacter changlensis TaxID=402884 RepID=A0A2T4JPD6_9RHOB|nr:alcohol dehydrogenase catalytic domain-containing protein [Cereibacter changlensis]PTE19734.1 sorbitol dehydrogenase [Cereibacter changlensis JA139]PZX50031.1 L-iditol 2-dehydrogenase [Cereibacter changlensis]